MKKLLLIAAVFIIAFPSFTQTKEEEPEVPAQNFFYRMNGKGDQQIKIALMPNFPLNFGKQLYVGGAASMGYYRFLNSWLAVGGEVSAGYNPTLGGNIFTHLPVTGGVLFQPTLDRFEFPFIVSAGFAFETCQNKKYFPGFAGKLEAGVFYRIAESFSFGIGTDFIYLPQWIANEIEKSDYGLFFTAFIGARYHL